MPMMQFVCENAQEKLHGNKVFVKMPKWTMNMNYAMQLLYTQSKQVN